jgi:hypothetical protein
MTRHQKGVSSMTTKSIQKQQEQDAKKAAFRALVLQIDTGLKAEQATAEEGEHTAQLARVAQSPSLAGLQRYSPLNQLLILAQCPHATDTAGYIGWKERGYQVRKGEKAIYVVAPHEKKQTEGKEGGQGDDPRAVGFHRTPVFDISQVDPITQDDQAAAQAATYDVDAADEADMRAYEAQAPEGGESKREEPDAATSESAVQ